MQHGAKALRPSIKIYGVEAETANDTFLSFKKGERVSIAPPPTIADGIRNLSPGALTFPINKKTLTDVRSSLGYSAQAADAAGGDSDYRR